MSYSDLKKGSYVVIQDLYPCKIVDIKLSAPGKHGHAKKLVVAKDIITDKKYEDIFTHHSIVKVPEIKRTSYQLNYVDDDGYMSLMDDVEPYDDVKLPDNELGEEIRSLVDDDKYLDIIIMEVSFDDKVFEKVVEYREQK